MLQTGICWTSPLAPTTCVYTCSVCCDCCSPVGWVGGWATAVCDTCQQHYQPSPVCTNQSLCHVLSSTACRLTALFDAQRDYILSCIACHRHWLPAVDNGHCDSTCLLHLHGIRRLSQSHSSQPVHTCAEWAVTLTMNAGKRVFLQMTTQATVNLITAVSDSLKVVRCWSHDSYT